MKPCWYHAHPDYVALWPALERQDMEELQRQLTIAQQQSQEQQRTIDSLTETVRQLREQLACKQRYMGSDTSNTHDQL